MLAHGRSSLCELSGVYWMQTPPPTDVWLRNGEQKGNLSLTASSLGSPHPISPTLPHFAVHHELCCVGKSSSPGALREASGHSEPVDTPPPPVLGTVPLTCMPRQMVFSKIRKNMRYSK